MRKNLIRFLAMIIILSVIYLSGVGYYAEKFSANTLYGNIDISNLTLDQAKEKIQADYNDSQFTLTENGKVVAEINFFEFSPQYNNQAELEASYNLQNPNQWVNGIFQKNNYNPELEDNILLSEKTIISVLKDQGIDNNERIPATDASIDYSEADGYYITEGEAGTTIDPELMSRAIINGLETDSFEIALEDVYAQPKVSANHEEITDIIKTINEIISTKITYEISGDQITIPDNLIEKWIYFDENNQIIIDPESVRLYLESINNEYSTYNTYRNFESTLQGTVEVPPGILGWGIDIDREIENLIRDIHAGEDLTRAPAFKSSGGVPGAENEIGNTYIEIDLTYQYMYLYVDGQIIVETPIVSGKTGAETVPGANAVNEMLFETELKGYNPFSKVNYSTPVDYWIRFDNNAQGIHDASWQGSFGGQVWEENGSLGCINTPHSAVATIYEYVEYGTPVIVFY